MSHENVRQSIFVFILRVSMLIITGIALHDTDTASVQTQCSQLWELTTAILVMKCVKLTLCPLLFRVIRVRSRWMDLWDGGLYATFFIAQCVLTSQSLNSRECIKATSAATGYPLLVFVNFALCIHDGAYVLAHALYSITF